MCKFFVKKYQQLFLMQSFIVLNLNKQRKPILLLLNLTIFYLLTFCFLVIKNNFKYSLIINSGVPLQYHNKFIYSKLKILLKV